jgi:O-antigen/teichoic acid export membrane protein
MSISKNFLSIFKRDTFLYVTSILNGIFLARILGPYSLGIWGILTFITSSADGYVRTKADNAAVYFLGKKIYKKDEIYHSLNLIAIITSGLFVIFFFINFDSIYLWLFKNTNNNYRLYVGIILFIIPIQFLYMNHAYFFISEENIKKYNLMTVIQAIVNSLISITFLLTTSFGLMSLIIGLFAGNFVALFYAIYSIDKTGWSKFKIKPIVITDLLKYSSNIYLAGLLGQLQQSSTMFFLVRFLVPSEISFINQGQAISKLLNKISDPLSTLLFPHISKLSNEDAVITTCKSFRILLIILMPFACIMFFLIKPFILLLYGNAFNDSVIIVYQLLPGVVVSGLSGVFINYFTGTGKAKLIPIFLVTPILVQIFLSWKLIPIMGTTGVVISINSGLFLYGVSLLIYFLNIRHAKIIYLIPNISDFKFLYKTLFAKI